MKILAIDPGATGGVVVIDDKSIIYSYQFDGDVVEIVKALERAKSFLCAGDIAVREDVHSMPNQGVVSTFTFGYYTGILDGWAASCGSNMQLITPQSWNKLLMFPPKVDQKLKKRVGPMCMRECGCDIKASAEGAGDAFLISLAVWKQVNGIPHPLTTRLDFQKLLDYAVQPAKKREELTQWGLM